MLLSENHEQTIAIIATECMLPGAENVNKFWDNIKNNKISISSFSQEELKDAGISIQELNNPKYIKASGIVDNIDLFDADFFGYSPYDAKIMDPQHRLFLEACWTVLEKAGYCPDKCSQQIGIFAGMGISRYLHNNLLKNKNHMGFDYQNIIATSPQFLTTKVSYKLNLTGPSISINTACSTSLVATIMAAQQLLNYDCDIAIAGGVTIRTPSPHGYLYQDYGIYSNNGECRAFDFKSSGTVPSSGLGVVVLKRLENAIADGDHIEALIIGSAINNDGMDKVGYTAPSVMGQAKCIAEAIAAAEISPDDISYIEAHGTGTNLGDPIEIEALTKAFRSQTDKKQFCGIGSVKTNIGHTDCAAGVASVIKTVCALKEKQIPASLNFEEPNPNIDFANSPFYVNAKLQKWHTIDDKPRRAGVSSFGIGGTNAHVVLQEAPKKRDSSKSRQTQALTLSAKTETALQQQIKNLHNFLQKKTKSKPLSAKKFADIAYTLKIGRKDFKHRYALTATDAAETIKLLENPTQLHKINNSSKQIVFMFPGQGAQYPNMGLGLYKDEPVFRQCVDHCCEFLQPYLDMDLRELLFPKDVNYKKAREQLKQTQFTQPAMFIIEYAMAELFLSWGIKPQAVIGHSIGEYAAAVIAGVFKLEDALLLISCRGQLISELPSGAMLGVPLPEDEIKAFMTPELSISTINAPSLCVISGPHEAITDFSKKVESFYFGQKVHTFLLHTSHAFHSQMMDPVLPKFLEFLNTMPINPPQIPFISTKTGTKAKAAELQDPEYWSKHIRETVHFSDGVNYLLKNNYQLFLELGPGNTLSTLVDLHPKKDNVISIPSMLAAKSSSKASNLSAQTTHEALMQLWLYGIEIDWETYYQNETRNRVQLPTYPFEKKSYWVEPDQITTEKHVCQNKGANTDWLYFQEWQHLTKHLKTNIPNNKTWLIFYKQTQINQALIRSLKIAKQNIILVKSGNEFGFTDPNEYKINIQDESSYAKLLNKLHQRKSLPDYIVNLLLMENENSTAIEKEGYHSLILFTKSFINLSISKSYQYVFILDKLFAINKKEKTLPFKAQIIGPKIVIPQEHQNIKISIYDISNNIDQTKPNIINKILELICNKNTPSLIALRKNQVFIPHYQRITDNNLNETIPLKKQETYIICGGLGNIGLTIAEYLAKDLHANLVLVSKLPFPSASEWDLISKTSSEKKLCNQIKNIQQLQTYNIKVVIKEANVANYQQVEKVFKETENQFGTIGGVIYAAGNLGNGVHTFVEDMNSSITKQQFETKVKGLIILDKAISKRKIPTCIICSSVSSILGGIGFSAYAAGNAFIDHFVFYKNAEQTNTKWLSINWDGWNFSEKKQKKVDSLSKTEGINAFKTLIKIKNHSQIIVSKTDFLTRITQSQKDIDAINLKKAQVKQEKQIPQTNDKIEDILKSIFSECLGVDAVSSHDDFFSLGGHSLSALKLISQIEDRLHKKISLSTIYKYRTVSSLKELILEDSTQNKKESCLIQIRPEGTSLPIFMIHPIGGTSFIYLPLINHLDQNHPVYAIEDPSLTNPDLIFDSINDLASFYINKIRKIQPHGPYILGGASAGGNIAFEIAQQLKTIGEDTKVVIMLDSWAAFSKEINDKDLLKQSLLKQQKYLQTQLDSIHTNNKITFLDLQWKRMQMLIRHNLKPGDINILLFKAETILPEYAAVDNETNNWHKYVKNNLIVHNVPGDHLSISIEPNVEIIADIINSYLSTT